jgi:hypothetical protein
MRSTASTQHLEVIATPAKSEVSDNQYDYVPPVHVICAADQVFIDRKRKYKKKSEDSKSARTDKWLFDSAASIHVMPSNTYC